MHLALSLNLAIEMVFSYEHIIVRPDDLDDGVWLVDDVAQWTLDELQALPCTRARGTNDQPAAMDSFVKSLEWEPTQGYPPRFRAIGVI